MFEYEAADGYYYQIDKVSFKGKEITSLLGLVPLLIGKGNEFTLDVTLYSPDDRRISVTNISVSVSKLMSLIKMIQGVDASSSPGDFVGVLFGEAKALMEMVR
jgi:hypothetical protein